MKLAYISETIIPSRSASVVHVLRMCEAFRKLGHDVTLFYVAAENTDLDRMFQSYGIQFRFEMFGVPRAGRRTFLYEYGLRVAAKTRAMNPDLAVCRNIPGCLACAALGVPVVYEAHMPARSRGQATEWLFRLLLRRKAFLGLVVISESLKRYFEGNYDLRGREILVLPDAA